MNFNGYLIKSVKSGKEFPHELIVMDSYKSTPLQRTEIKAYRDSNNLLRRVTSPNCKTKIEFSTYELSLAQLKKINDFLRGAYSNSLQRKLEINYWDDELLDYRNMTAYIPDITYPVKCITKEGNIKYSPITFTFIEY